MRSEDWSTLSILYQTKNLTQASKQLFISQPALTIRLQNIEKELGLQIAIRSNKGLLFTPEGEYLAQQAIEITELAEKTIRYVKTMQIQNSGTIKLIVPATLFRYYLIDLLREYGKIMPNTKFHIEVVSSSESAEKISALDAYCGFVHGDYCGNLPRIHLATIPAYAVSKTPITLTQLPTLPLIAHNTTEKTNMVIQDWWVKQFSTKMNIQMSVKDIDICLQLIDLGLGAGIIFGDFFKKDYDLYTLPLVNPDGLPLTRDIWFLYAPEVAESPCVSQFITFLRTRPLGDEK